VFSLFSDKNKKVDGILKKALKGKADIEVKDSDKTVHAVYRIADKKIIDSIQKELSNKKLFIADGHHRYETALNYKKQMVGKNKNHTGDEPYNFIMMYLCAMDDSGLVVFPTHRLLKDLPKFNESAFMQNLSAYFDVIITDKKDLFEYMEKNIDKHVFGLYMGKAKFYALTLKSTIPLENIPDAWKELDVAILHKVIIENILGITEKEVKLQKNIKYTADSEEGIRQIDNGFYELLLFLNSTKLSQIKEISLNGEVMPQKSTYFYPKLLTGLVINKL